MSVQKSNNNTALLCYNRWLQVKMSLLAHKFPTCKNNYVKCSCKFDTKIDII